MNETSTRADEAVVGAPSADEPSGDARSAAAGGGGAAQPSEEELRAAYEAELNRITSADLVLQTVASLLNLGARRLGLTGDPEAERDLEQVRDAIDGVSGLMPIIERRYAGEVGQLRDALSRLQMAYAREAPRPAGEQKPAGEQAGAAPGSPKPGPDARPSGPGPAETSGRLWVPGR
jgi:hypothetical protein